MYNVNYLFDTNREAVDSNTIYLNIRDICQLVSSARQKIKNDEGFSVATLNLDHLVTLQKNREFVDAYQQHDFITADGFPIVWACRLLGHKIERTTGSDLIFPFCEYAAREKIPIAIFGTSNRSISRAVRRLESAYPGIRIMVARSPSEKLDPYSSEATEFLKEIDQLGVRLCFLALGAPKQEIISVRGRELAPLTGFVSVGASIDFIAGLQTRAPKIAQQLNLEWAWRLGQDPKRLARRYMDCMAILPSLMISALMRRLSNSFDRTLVP